jgi:FAD:protein FMN transferase
MRVIILLYFLILGNFCFSQSKKYTFSQPKMGSPLNITLYADDSIKAHKIATEAYKIADSLNLIYSDYLENSELNLLSKNSGTNEFIKVSPAFWDILKLSIKASQKSKGAFDITVGSIVKLWRKARKEKVLPDKNILDNALQSVSYQYLIIDSIIHSVKLLQPNTQLDLGGIAKGYVAQVIVDFCKKEGIQKVLVDAGGDLAMNAPPAPRGGAITSKYSSDSSSKIPPLGVRGLGLFRIGITIPNSEELIPRHLVLQNQAVATSGNMYQYVEIKGKRYSHIVNPHTGLGVTHQRNVTVIAPDGATADWLATACSVLSIKKALKLIKSMPNCELLMAEIQKGKLKMWQSEGFEGYLEEVKIDHR